MATSMPLAVFFLLFVSSSASKCPQSFACGNLGSLEFPLADSKDRPECGLFTVDCTEPENPRIQLTGGGKLYQILEKISVNRFRLRDPVLQEGLRISKSCLFLRNLSLPFNPSVSLTFSPNITFFTCDSKSNISGSTWDLFKGYMNYTGCGAFTVFYSNSTDQFPPGSGDVPGCAAVQMPVKSKQDSGELFDMLAAEFEVAWNLSEACVACHEYRGGQCLANNLNQFQCKKGSICRVDSKLR